MSRDLFRWASSQTLYRRLDGMLWTSLHRVTWGNPRQARELGLRITAWVRRIVRPLELRP
jgi:hypothetical protein